MDRLRVFLAVLLGASASSQDLRNTSVTEMTVAQGENITLYCDCKSSVGEYIVWYRNCTHEKQPSLVLKTWVDQSYLDPVSINEAAVLRLLNPFPNFHLVKNDFSQSYDLLITNISDSDEGLYYCGTEQPKVKDEAKITREYVRTYGNNKTKVLLHKNSGSCEPHNETCWMLFYCLCPAFAVLSSLLSSLLICYCQKTGKKPQDDEKRCGHKDQTRRNQNEDVCYAALEVRQTSQRPKKRTVDNSDFSTYSAILAACNDPSAV